MKKRQTVKYLRRDELRDKNDYLAVKWMTAIVEGAYTKRYHNTIGLLVGLSPCALLLLNYVVEVMDEKNIVYNNTELKTNFNKIVFKGSNRTYSNTAINRAFNEMTEVRIFIKISKIRSMYRVNPKYFFNGNETNRIKEIRIDFEQRDIRIVNRYRALTYNEDIAKKNMKLKLKNKNDM